METLLKWRRSTPHGAVRVRAMPILACFIREQYTADATFTRLENKVWFENSANAWGNYRILYHKTNKEASIVLCSIVKHLGSDRALKK